MSQSDLQSHSTSAWSRITPWCCSLIPALCGLGFSLIEARPSPAQPGLPRAPLAFHQYAVNLGRVEPRRDHFAIFAFTNKSDEAIELRELKTSCGCVTQHQDRKVFQPREDGEFALRIQSANQEPGPKRYTCKAIYGPVGKPEQSFEADLVFQVWLPESSVMVRPRVLIVHQPTAVETVKPIAITDLRPKPMKIRNASCELPFVTVTIRDATELTEKDNEAGVISMLDVKVTAVPSGRHETEIRVATDDPEFNVLRIPVRLHGPEPKSELKSSQPKFEPTDASDS